MQRDRCVPFLSSFLLLAVCTQTAEAWQASGQTSPPNQLLTSSHAPAHASPLPSSTIGLGSNLVINGDFENNTAGCDSNLSNPAFDAEVANATAFGDANEIDVYNDLGGCGFGSGPISGTTKIAIHRQAVDGITDAFSLDLSSPVVAGQSYRLTFLAEANTSFDPDIGAVVVGLSSNPTSSGVEIFRGTPQLLHWTLLQHDFVAPVNATHLTMEVSNDEAWIHVDAFTLTLETSCFGLDFSTEDDFTTPLGNGQTLSTPPEFGALVSVSSAGANLGMTTFDSTPGGPNSGTSDPDMLIDKGNILMLQDSSFPAQTVAGFFDTPTDDPDGGDLIFDYATPSEPQSVVLIDLDPPPNLGASVTLTDSARRTRVYTVPAGWTGTYGGTPGWKSLDLTTLAGQVGNAPGFWVATASEMAGFDAFAVERIVVHMTGRGAMDDLSVCPPVLMASALSRNGSGMNRVTLDNASLPVLGGTWTASLDCTGFGNGLALLSVRSQAIPGTTTLFGERLIGGTLLHQTLRTSSGSSNVFSLNLPNDPALIGLTVHAQGLCRSASSAVGKMGSLRGGLSNALDLVLGF